MRHIRHARHDSAINAAENAVKKKVKQRDQKYIIIICDGPQAIERELSFVSNFDFVDVGQVCDAVAKQIKSESN